MSQNCQHKNTWIFHRAGWDVWPGGEEYQHIETCKDCGSKRFVCDVIVWQDEDGNDLPETKEFVSEGNWGEF